MAIPALEIHSADSSASQSALTHDATPSAVRDAVLPTYKRSIEMVRGEGVYLIDSDGNRYLDFVSGIAVNALGYSDAGLAATLRTASGIAAHVESVLPSVSGRSGWPAGDAVWFEPRVLLQ